MNNSNSLELDGLLPNILLLGTLIFVIFLGLTNRKFLWVRGDKSAIITIGIIGMALCTRGIGRVAEAGAWTHPLAIIAYLLGITIIVITVLIAVDQPIPMITNSRMAMFVIVSMIGLKFIISIFHMTVFTIR